jgi:patatin-like phospholipase/acyl hydrolase
LIRSLAEEETLVLTETRLHPIGPKKLLAMDGGGIRGVLSLEVLKGIEDTLTKSTQPAIFRLSDYFDYIAGTRTGGIIAAGLSIGTFRWAPAQVRTSATVSNRAR